MPDALEDPTKLEDILTRYSAMKRAFEENGFPELFQDPSKLNSFLNTHRQVREEFREVGLEKLLDDPQVARDFLQKYEQGEYDRHLVAKLRQVFEEEGRGRLLDEYEVVSTAAGDDEEDDE